MLVGTPRAPSDATAGNSPSRDAHAWPTPERPRPRRHQPAARIRLIPGSRSTRSGEPLRRDLRPPLEQPADALARKFHETHDMAVKDEFEHLLKEYGKLDKPWEFVAR